jgi:hypothetical protein
MVGRDGEPNRPTAKYDAINLNQRGGEVTNIFAWRVMVAHSPPPHIGNHRAAVRSSSISMGSDAAGPLHPLVEHQLVVRLGGLQAIMVRALMVRLGQSKE